MNAIRDNPRLPLSNFDTSNSCFATSDQEKKSKDQLDKLTEAFKTVIECVGEDPGREGLARTPLRAAKALSFFTKGYEQTITGKNSVLSQCSALYSCPLWGAHWHHCRLHGTSCSHHFHHCQSSYVFVHPAWNHIQLGCIRRIAESNNNNELSLLHWIVVNCIVCMLRDHRDHILFCIERKSESAWPCEPACMYDTRLVQAGMLMRQLSLISNMWRHLCNELHDKLQQHAHAMTYIIL